MTEEGAEEPFVLLAEERLGRTGLEVKLDWGFAEGTYGVTVELCGVAAYVAMRREQAWIHTQSAS